jgi:hypothetical protein
MLALLCVTALSLGQTPAQRPTADSAGRAVSSRAAQTTADTATLAQEIARRRAAGETYLPDADHFTFGDRTIESGTRVDGPVAVAYGNLDVYGTVNGDVATLRGDVRVHKGGRVTGNAWAAAGALIVDGGTVEGEKRSIAIGSSSPAPVQPASRPLTTGQSVKLVVGWFALLAIIGLGVMVFAEQNLDGVVLALERGFARSFWTGLVGEVLMLPALLVLVVALAITVLGVLLIPFAIVAYVVAAAGLFTLGFLAVARLTGGGLASQRGTTSPRGVHLRAFVIGLLVYAVVWALAAAFTWSPLIGAVLRAIAIALTWVAATVGLGAAITSRGGTQRPGAGKAAPTSTDEFAWQTPTPVAGVAAAARRSVSSVR